jgi:uncharacterized protein YjbI with pentapeptide repeats
MRDTNSVRIFTQPELNKLLALHERHGHAATGLHTDLKGAKLDGLNLANRRLNGINFTGASLVGATLFGSNLSQARLYGVDLRRSDLRNANMTGADLRGALLNRANLSYARLDKADMRAASMLKTGPDGLLIVDQLESFNGKRGASRVGVDFTNCSMKGVSFGGAQLQGADFSGALLEDAVFRGAKLIDTTFRGAVLTGVNIKELNLPPSAFEGCILAVTPEAEERAVGLKAALEAHEQWVVSGGKRGKPAVLDGEDLRPLHEAFAGKKLTALSARNALAISIDFSGAELQGGKFQGADMRDADFTGADLSGASFTDAKLTHAVFVRAKLMTLQLLRGDCVEPDFTGTEIREEQLQQAIRNEAPQTQHEGLLLADD